MQHLEDNILSITNNTPGSILKSVSEKVRARRLEKNLTQRAFASRAGLSFGTYKRFEACGEISFRGLIMIANALGMTDDFKELFGTGTYQSMDDLINMNKVQKRQRGGRNE